MLSDYVRSIARSVPLAVDSAMSLPPKVINNIKASALVGACGRNTGLRARDLGANGGQYSCGRSADVPVKKTGAVQAPHRPSKERTAILA